MNFTEGIGLLTGFLVLAGLTVAIVHGTQTAQVLGAASGGFSQMIKAATLTG